MSLYFEKQAAALCAVHALNTLLQGPYFSEIDLAHLAHDLDALERALMAESGVDGADFLRYAAEESGNVAASGMFSIQVLDKALEVWNLSALPLTSPAAAAARAEPQAQAAFICNLQEHWFTVRPVYGEWYNFNSLFAAPEPLSAFYLEAFLASLREQGYTIFVIQGLLPGEPHPEAGTTGGHGQWFSPEEARAAAQQSQKLKKSGFLQAAARGALDLASAAGNRMTLRSTGGGTKRGHGSEDGEGEDAALARALAASRADARGGAGGSGLGGGGGGGGLQDDEDADLAAAIAASMQDAVPAHPSPPPAAEAVEEAPSPAAPAPAPADVAVLPALGEPPEAGGPGVLELGVRLPSGQRHSRRFGAGDSVGHVAAFAAGLGVDMSRHRLATSFPRSVLADWGQGLRDAGVGNKQVLSVEPA
jgi:ataxin-3